MKKTKIICTIGPSSNNHDVLKDMIDKGMDVARINLSHSNHEFAESVVNNIRTLNKELNTNVGILFDTKGPEIRVGTFEDGYIELKRGEEVIFTPNKDDCNNKIYINQKDLYLDLDIDSLILLDDGKITLRVTGIVNEEITAIVINGGILESNKSVNIKDIDLNISFLSNDDKNDILFASRLNADFIALSYVRSADDVLDVNDILIDEKNEHTSIISKIENRRAINDIDNIIKVSDGVMVARGDLGAEIEIEKLPCLQKEIIKKARNNAKICIVATEILSSMEKGVIPTKSEVTDISNAIIDGVDALMLSAETAIGKYPVLTIETMAKIIIETEKHLDYNNMLLNNGFKSNDITNILAYNATNAANMLNCKAIVVSSITGYTARQVSNYRPSSIIITTTPEEETARSLSLNWGIIPVVVKKSSSTDEIVETSKIIAKDLLDLEEDDKIIITGGFPIKKVRSTNFIKIEEI